MIPILREKAYQVRENIERGRNRVPYNLKVGDIVNGVWKIE